MSDDYQTSTNHQVNTVSNICALAIRAINLIVNWLLLINDIRFKLTPRINQIIIYSRILAY